MYPSEVIIEEQSLRDGLQSEPVIVSTEHKLAAVEALVRAGVRRIQLTSFVNPKLVPQMADAEALVAQLAKKPGVVYSALVLNVRGLARAATAGLGHVSASLSASDTHSRRNANKSLPEAQAEMAEMVREGKRAGLAVRGGIQCAFGCRYEGHVPPQRVLDLAKQHLDLGVDELALADSTGMGHPRAVRELMAQVMALAGPVPVMLHLHDTEGKGLANLLAALECGVKHFDTAFGGLGGCPFIKGATGNIATEDAAWMLAQMGIATGLDLRPIAELTRQFEGLLGKKFPGKMSDLLLAS
jgi:hydroxymethylglutaryl-CoA lyase